MRRAASLLCVLALTACGSSEEQPAPAPAPETPAAPSAEEPSFDRYELLMEELQALIKDDVSFTVDGVRYRLDMKRIEGCLDEAQELAGTEERKAEVADWRSLIEENRQAYKDYAAAIKVVDARDYERYPEAQRTLRAISKRTNIHGDAQAYADWIGAALLVYAARDDYDRGDFAKALAKLDEAATVKVLGPEALASLEEQRDKWTLAVRNCREGIVASRAGKGGDAQAAFKRVLELEANEERPVHRLALAHLAHLEGDTEDLPEQTLAFGETLLALDAALFPDPVVEPVPEAEREEWGPDDWSDAEDSGDEPADDASKKPDEDDGWSDEWETEEGWDDGEQEDGWSDEGWEDDDEGWEDDDGGWKQSAPAPTQPEPPPPPPLTEPATVTGRVLQPSGRPVPGARILLGDSRYLTDASGAFTISTRKPEALELTAYKPGYIPATPKLEPLTAGETRDVGVLRVAPGGGYKGRFVAQDGSPLEVEGMLWSGSPGATSWGGHELEGTTFSYDPWTERAMDLRFEVAGYEEVVLEKVANGTHDLVVKLRKVSRVVATFRRPDGTIYRGKLHYLLCDERGGAGSSDEVGEDGTFVVELQPKQGRVTYVELEVEGCEPHRVDVKDLPRGEDRVVELKLKPKK